MSVYVRLACKSGELSKIKTLASYIMDEEKTSREMCLTEGISRETVYEDMVFIKKIHRKLDGRQVRHEVLSFDEGVTADTALEVGRDVMKLFSEKVQVLAGVHCNTNNVHIHLMINTVDFKTGKKFSESGSDMRKSREKINEILVAHGLNPIGKVAELNEEKWDELFESGNTDTEEVELHHVRRSEFTDQDVPQWFPVSNSVPVHLSLGIIMPGQKLVRGVTYDPEPTDKSTETEDKVVFTRLIDGERFNGYLKFENGKTYMSGLLYAADPTEKAKN